ncbi:lipase-like PAD4 isoform X2 [Tasmannia lanceolata]|uniref:lipase-like PAD4 isoform X2 n=1 Tax=Tasmannia lanceolata TaxID=3420 RepID=UPI0040637163
MEAQGEAPPFETSQTLGLLLGSTPILSDAWRQCSVANTMAPGSFVIDLIGDVAYIAFSGVQALANPNPMDGIGPFCEVPITKGNNLFSVVGDYDGKPTMVNAGFLDLFLSMYRRPELWNQISATVSNHRAVVFTGHSLGGTIASLAALSLLSSFPSLSSLSLLCITFGSPLLGNAALSRAILQQRWGGKFCHVVSKSDIGPTLLFAPITPISTQIDHILKFWHSYMRFPHQCTKPIIQLSDKEIDQLGLFLSTHVKEVALAEEKATEEEEDDLMTSLRSDYRSPYKPFGSYLFCSGEGGICIDNQTAVVRMLHHLMFTANSVDSRIEDHLTYGETVLRLSNQFLRRRSFDDKLPESGYEAGISLALEASGMGKQVSAQARSATRECLMMARQMGRKPNLNSANLAIRLSKITPCRAQIEWYKAYCEDYMGYYDSFKLRRAPKRDSAVNMNRIKLAKFWDIVIDMIQSNQLPHDFHKRAKWVNASQFYKLLVEPLDIAEYYRMGKRRTHGHYMAPGRQLLLYHVKQPITPKA